MFKKVRDLFGNNLIPHEEPAEDDVFAELRWIEASESPFGIRVLDCRPVALGLTTTTADPSVAQRFLALRSSSGIEHLGQVPSNAKPAQCDLVYPAGNGRSVDGALFVANEMEDKWDIYLHAGYLYFARSWTGILVSRARLKLIESTAYVDMVEVDPVTADSPEHAIRHVDYLIKSHLYQKEAPHPIPTTIQPVAREIAMYSFSLYGRRGQFASYEDTTQVKIS